MLISPQILSQCVIGNFCTETETAHSRLSLCFCFAGESWTFCSRQLSLISFSHSYDTIMPDDGGMRCQIWAPLCQYNSADYQQCQIECMIRWVVGSHWRIIIHYWFVDDVCLVTNLSVTDFIGYNDTRQDYKFTRLTLFCVVVNKQKEKIHSW